MTHGLGHQKDTLYRYGMRKKCMLLATRVLGLGPDRRGLAIRKYMDSGFCVTIRRVEDRRGGIWKQKGREKILK